MTAQEKEGLHLPIKGLEELQAPKRAIRSSFASHSIVGWSRTWDSLALAPLLPDRMPPLDYFLKPALVAEALNYQQTGCVFMCSRSTFIHKPVKLQRWVGEFLAADPGQLLLDRHSELSFTAECVWSPKVLSDAPPHMHQDGTEQQFFLNKREKECRARLFFNRFCF